MEDAELEKKREVLLDYLVKSDKLMKERRKELIAEVITTPIQKEEAKTITKMAVLSVEKKETIEPVAIAQPEIGNVILNKISEKNQTQLDLTKLKEERLKIESLSNKRELLERELASTVETKIEKKVEEQQPIKEVVYQKTAKEVEQERRFLKLEAEHKKEQGRLKRYREKMRLKLERQKNRQLIWAKIKTGVSEELKTIVMLKERIVTSSKACIGSVTSRSRTCKPILHSLCQFVKQWLLGGTALVFGVYLFFLIIVYTFSPSSLLFNELNNYLPVPALFSSYGMVDYFDFKRVAEIAKRAKANDEDVTSSILRDQIMRAVARSYFVDETLDSNLLQQVLRRRVIEDVNFNKATTNRYYDLRVALRTSKTLSEISAKTKLKINTKIVTTKMAAREFGPAILGLSKNAISNAIINERGIYVLSLEHLDDDKLMIDYVYLPARTFDQMVRDKMSEGWIINFVN
jgi:hypothetical protein